MTQRDYAKLLIILGADIDCLLTEESTPGINRLIDDPKRRRGVEVLLGLSRSDLAAVARVLEGWCFDQGCPEDWSNTDLEEELFCIAHQNGIEVPPCDHIPATLETAALPNL